MRFASRTLVSYASQNFWVTILSESEDLLLYAFQWNENDFIFVIFCYLSAALADKPLEILATCMH